MDAHSGRFLPEWLAQRAYLSPDQPALWVGERRWTYAELDRAVRRVAALLAEAGVEPGERVALLLRNGAGFALLVHALIRRRAVLVPLNTRLAPAEIAFQLADAEARLLVCDEHTADAAAAAARPGLRCLAEREVLAVLDRPHAPEAADPPGRLDLEAVQSIIYTSGTTGRPKGARITYGNLWWSAIGSVLNLGLHPDDRWLACLPLFHIGGLSILIRAVIYGITAIVHPRFDPAAVNRAIDTEGVTIISVVSTMLQRMLEDRGGRPYPPSLRCVLLGGGPAPRPLLEACARQGVPVVQTYGLTETASQAATLSPADALRKLGSAGKPLLPLELRVERDGRPAAPGEIGEIVVRGPTVSPGYVNFSDAATDRQDGWLRTGDLGYLDAEGFLYVVDRRDDLIVSGGENIYPAEVEAVLQAHPAVAEAGVVGLPDPQWGQVPAAAVRLRPGAAVTAEELRAFCRERLAHYKAPVAVRIVDALPRNAAGKLLRRALRAHWPDRPASPDAPAEADETGRPAPSQHPQPRCQEDNRQGGAESPLRHPAAEPAPDENTGHCAGQEVC